MHKKYVYSLIILALLCLLPAVREPCTALAASLFRRYEVYETAAQALPEEGQYFCEALNALLTFGDSITIRYADGTVETLYRPHHEAWLDGGDQKLDAAYRWDREKDAVQLTPEKFPGEFQAGMSYSFIKQD